MAAYWLRFATSRSVEAEPELAGQRARRPSRRAAGRFCSREEIPHLHAPRVRRADARHHRHRALSRSAPIRSASRDCGKRCTTCCAIRARYPACSLIANGTDRARRRRALRRRLRRRGLFATYDFGRRTYRPTTDDERAWKLGVRSTARSAVARRPVFTIEYADVGDLDLSVGAQESSQRWVSSLRGRARPNTAP